MKILKRNRLARVSPWVLAAACGLLTLIIAVFAVNNYWRDKALMTDILLEKGATLIRFIASSSRNSIVGGLRTGKSLDDLWPEAVQMVLGYASGHPGVEFLALVNSDGMIVANAEPEDRNRMVSEQTKKFVSTLDEHNAGSRSFSFRIANEKKPTVFQIAAMLPPIEQNIIEQITLSLRRSVNGGEESLTETHIFRQELAQKWQNDLEKLNKEQFIILVELDMTQFNQRLERQKLEIIILSIVLLLVGIGGWLSILTLEGLKGSQVRLRRIEAFRDILISSLPVGLIATDNKGKVVLYNRFSQEFTGITEKRAIDSNPSVFKNTPEIRGAFEDSGVALGESYQKEIRVVGKDGDPRILQLNRLAIVDRETKFVGTLLLMQDLSQVKNLEEDLRRSERLAALGKMAAGVAHELRNPLSSIKGLALVLQSKFQQNNRDRETATILVQEVERLNRSISELLDYARPQQLKKKYFDMSRLLEKAVSLIRIDADAAGVELDTAFEEKLPPLYGDEDKLTQVVLNLLLNGIQAMENGGVLTVRVGATERKIEIVVSDTGCGIKEKDLGRVFDPYFTTKPDGTGLGMAMSAKIVEEHGGEVKLQSEYGTGTSVIIDIPITGVSE